MSVGVTLKQRGASESEGVQAVSNMSLGTPADISLARGTPAIVASDKLGSDLALSFADGKTLLVRDFFVIGEEGDFSRLLLPNGEAFVTGLMGPEPSYITDRNAQGSVEAGSCLAFPRFKRGLARAWIGLASCCLQAPVFRWERELISYREATKRRHLCLRKARRKPFHSPSRK